MTLLRINTAGVPCFPYSAVGNHAGVSHVSHPADTASQCERKVLARRGEADVAILESVPGYPLGPMRDFPAETHTVISITEGPELHGCTAKRRRLLDAAINQ